MSQYSLGLGFASLKWVVCTSPFVPLCSGRDQHNHTVMNLADAVPALAESTYSWGTQTLNEGYKAGYLSL